MTDDAIRGHRRSIRLKGYDYSRAGAYFVTICTAKRRCLLADIFDGRSRLTDYGEIVTLEWLRTADERPNVVLDAFIVMPNHLHAIIALTEGDRRGDPAGRPYNTPAHPHGPVPGSVAAILGQFKSIAAKRINVLRGTPGELVWQRNYYEHVIRNEIELDHYRQYILENPVRWDLDEENPNGQAPLDTSPDRVPATSMRTASSSNRSVY